MNPSGHTAERFQAGNLELDVGAATLRREGEEIALPKLSFDFLLCLVRHAPNVVTPDVLMDEVWGRVVVGEETVKQRVKLLRKALGDDSSNPRYIASIRGRGYRLLAEVSVLDVKSAGPITVDVSRKPRTAWLFGVAFLAAMAIGFWVIGQQDSPEKSISEAGPDSVTRGSTNNSEAWEAYLKGRNAYRRWTPRDNEVALAFYQRAIELDPGFALAIAGAANANALRATEFGLGEEWIDDAIEQARRALEIEPELPEALKALGICYVFKGQYQTALDYYRHALRLDPDYDEVIFNTAEIMHSLGRWDEAVEYQRLDAHRPQGLERLSIYLRDLGLDDQAATLMREVEPDLPVSYFTHASLSINHLLNGDFAQARNAAHAMQRAIPNAAAGWLREGEVDLFAGDLVSAAENFQAAEQVSGGFRDYARLRVAQLELLTGDLNNAEELLRQAGASALEAIANGHEGWFHRWHLAIVHALLGKHEEALDWFEQTVESGRRRYEWDELEPAFEPLRDETRFKAALQRQKDLRREMKENTVALLAQ